MSFVGHTSCDKCGSKDNFAKYRDEQGLESGFCFGCGFCIPSTEALAEKKKHTGIKTKPSFKEEEQKESLKLTKEIITEEKAKEIKQECVFTDFRDVRADTAKSFGVRYRIDEEDNITEQLYPCTFEGTLSGYKVREIPKNFYSIGATGAECQMFGEFKFNRGGKYVIITEGELCCLSAYQMLKDYNVSRGNDYEVATVSPTTGANSQKQIANRYKFFDTFDNIILAYDNDEAGQKAAEKVIKVLPKGKVKIMALRYKDPNDYLTAGKQKEFIQDFYNSKPYSPAGVVGSSDLYEQLLLSVQKKKIPLPPFLKKLDEMIGSVELGTIGIFAAGSGAAKTTVANEVIYYWLFNSPYKVGIVSLELTCGQYAQAMLSRHINRKIANIKDPEEKLKYLQQTSVKEKADELFKTADGQDRFSVIDERDGSIEALQDKIEEMIISCDVKVIVLDPISDLLDGLPNDQAALLMKWQKSMVKNYDVTFINIAHIRKGSNNKESASSGAFVPEEAIIGASQQVKSASWVVMMQRDKYNPDPIIKNTTKLVLSKNRANGLTGDAGSLYYDGETHRLHDLDEYMKENGLISY